jgi:hypothetical protein
MGTPQIPRGKTIADNADGTDKQKNSETLMTTLTL